MLTVAAYPVAVVASSHLTQYPDVLQLEERREWCSREAIPWQRGVSCRRGREKLSKENEWMRGFVEIKKIRIRLGMSGCARAWPPAEQAAGRPAANVSH